MKEFSSVLTFAEHLVAIEAGLAATFHSALKRAARVIEKDARAQIGEYQPEVGPFPEWAELADSTEYDKAQKGYPVDAPLLREGDLRNSIQHEVVGLEAVIGSQSDIAAYQEFGTPTIPPRPFIGPAAFKNKEKIQRILGDALVIGLTEGEVIHESLGYNMKISE